jgi:hypothetical protein
MGRVVDQRTEEDIRAELSAVRDEAVEQLERGEALGFGEIVGCSAGGMLLAAGLIALLAGLSSSAPLAVIGVVLLLLALLALRPVLRRQRRMLGEVRRLRRAERELLAQLPAGHHGPGVLRRYYARRFGSPAAVLVMVLIAVVLVVTLQR